MPAPAIPPSAMPPSDAYDSPHPQGKLPAALLMAGSCLPVLGAVLLAPVLPRMRDHFEGVAGSEALVPLVLTVPALSLALLAPFAGVVVDRLGRKRLLIVATVLYTVFGTVPLWVDSLYGIPASRVLVGVAEAAIMTACATLIGDYCTGRVRDRYLALQTMCASASATVFFALGGALGGAGRQAPFWVYGIGLLLAPAMARVLPTPVPSSGMRSEPNASTADKRPFPMRRMAGLCLLTAFGVAVSSMISTAPRTWCAAISARCRPSSDAACAPVRTVQRLTGAAVVPRRTRRGVIVVCMARSRLPSTRSTSMRAAVEPMVCPAWSTLVSWTGARAARAVLL
ncbi:MFS transporter [Streptomyces sp. NPDC005803]|uniref:MFS transporter n=1 Tax=Streptomyces sp. NPDC005803 TaxID=3154297 RepID=UPI003407C4FE